MDNKDARENLLKQYFLWYPNLPITIWVTKESEKIFSHIDINWVSVYVCIVLKTAHTEVGALLEHFFVLFELCWTPHAGLQIRVCNWKLLFLFLNQNICCGYSKEPSHRDGSFEHPKHMFNLMDKKIITILLSQILLNWPYGMANI